jgi:cytochrome c
MSSNLESNKIFAAILVAGITAMFAGFLARELVHPHELENDAVTIEGTAAEGGGASGPAMPEPILNLIATADIAKGEKLSKACAACHSFEKGEPGKVGPNLWNVVGGARASKPGFAYSEDMTKKGGSWSYNDLNHFIWKPKSFVPGTKMTFVGLKKGEDRAAVIAWLRTKADSPHALPSAGEIAQEAKELAPPAPAEGAAAAADAAKPAEAPKH